MKLVRGLPFASALMLLAAILLSGCGAGNMFRHRRVGRDMPRSRHSQTAALQQNARSEVREQRDASDPYWAYEKARHHMGDSTAVAEHELAEALALDPAYAPALALLSKLYFEQQRHAEGVSLLEAVRQHPGTWPAHDRAQLLAGLALHEDALGNAEQARLAMAEALTELPRDNASAVVYLALRGSAPDSAAGLAEEALRRNSKSAVSRNNAGIAKLRAGDVEGARRAFESAIERDASLPGPYYNLAILEKYYRLDDSAAGLWFAQYWNRSHDDPDGLNAVFSARMAQATPNPGVRQ